MTTRYIIIGAGAVGVTLAAELQRAGREVLPAAASLRRSARARCGTRGPTRPAR
jgi:glycine/D-amino acid oxidase-like deaminating enzyme